MDDAILAEIAAVADKCRGATAADILDAIRRGECPALAAEVCRASKCKPEKITTRAIGNVLTWARKRGAPLRNYTGHNGKSVWSVAGIPSPRRDRGRSKALADAGGSGVDDPVGPPTIDPRAHVPQAPPGYHLRGVSTLLDGAGNPVMQWVKTAQDPAQQRLDALLDEIKALPDSWREAHEPSPAPTCLDSDLLVVYPVADPHVGMYSWREETGEDYDVKIAEEVHVRAVRKLVQVAPAAATALVVGLGDWFHCDGNSARTSRSGNPLDTDTRFALVLRVGLRMFRAMIEEALGKHERVHVIVEIGNHDDLSSIMLAMALEAFYSRNPRVHVDTSPAPFHWFRFGKNLFGTTHGGAAKPEQLPGIMAFDRAEDWGQTQHRKWLVGHVHQTQRREFPGVTVEHYRTLAGRDAWANGEGHRSGRSMQLEAYHREFGTYCSHTIGIEAIR